MYNFALKLKDGIQVIIKECSFDNNKDITARIGIILPHTRCIEYLNISGWEATYKGSSASIKKKLLEVYNKNQMLIHKNIIEFVG
jgi:hypothetical protein